MGDASLGLAIQARTAAAQALSIANQALAQAGGSIAAGAYPNTAATTVPSGVAASATYWVLSADALSFQLYKNNAGVPAIVAGASFPSAAAVAARIDTRSPRYINGTQIAVALNSDPTGRVSTFIDVNGVLYANVALESDGSLSFSYNAATGRTKLSQNLAAGARGLGGGVVLDTTRTLFRAGRAVVTSIAGAGGRDGASILADGAMHVVSLETENGIGLERGVETANYFFAVRVVAGRRHLMRFSKATGIGTQVTFLGNNSHPALSLDGTAITYTSDRYWTGAGPVTWTTMYQPIDGGGEHPMISRPDIVCLGDSLTFGYGSNVSYPQYLQMPLGGAGIGVDNRGWGGQVTSQMARRIGATTAQVTVAGNQIAAGANAVIQMGGAALGTASTLGTIADEHRFLTHARADAVTAYGTLAGIFGTMLRTTDASNNEVYSFTPDPAIAQTLPAACPANALWQSVNDWRDKTVTFHGGYNDRAFPTAVKANIDAIVAYLAPKVRRFLIFTVATGASETSLSTGSGATNYANIVNTINPYLRATYPANVFDNWTYLIAPISDGAGGTTTQALKDAGITPVAGDLTDIMANCVPRSLRASGGTDNIHMIDAGYRAVAQNGVYPILAAKGWNVR